jgi:hypothetical protein
MGGCFLQIGAIWGWLAAPRWPAIQLALRVRFRRSAGDWKRAHCVRIGDGPEAPDEWSQSEVTATV